MFPTFYQTTLRAHLNESQYLTWPLLLLLLQLHRQVKLSVLASVFAQQIHYQSRKRKLGREIYAGRIQEHTDKTPRQSDFGLGLYGQRWRYGMEFWADWALNLMALKPHKRLYFQRGFDALSLIHVSSTKPKRCRDRQEKGCLAVQGLKFI